jgi:hypothetical protein
MSYSKFVLHLKSTIDKMVHGIAVEAWVEYFDLDSMVLPENIVNSAAPGIGWSLEIIVPNPIDPMYHIEWQVAVRTTEDPAQYISLDLMSLVLERVHSHMEVFIQDFTGDSAPTTNHGSLLVTDVRVSPQQFDRASGFRFVHVLAEAVKW